MDASVLQYVETSSGAYLLNCYWVPGTFFFGIKRQGLETNHFAI